MKFPKFGAREQDYNSYQNSKMVIVPVPYDDTSTWIRGATKGPEALLEASQHLELYDIETKSEVYKRGIFTDKAILVKTSPNVMIKAVQKRVAKHLNNEKFVVVIGGNHSVSIGTIQAHAQYYSDLCVLQLDAHSDLRDNFAGSKYSHASVMARAKEFSPIVQIGVRSMDIEEKRIMDHRRVLFAEDIFYSKDWIDRVIPMLSKNVYLTLDLDVFDPSIMPSTGTPEPGGLYWYQVLALIKSVIISKNLIGCDVVELCPQQKNKSPDFLAAKLIYKILTYRFELNSI